MRKKSEKQLPLMNPAIDHPQAKELERIGQVLDREPTIAEIVHQDLCISRSAKAAGAHGMSAKQVLRAAIFAHGGKSRWCIASDQLRSICFSVGQQCLKNEY